MSQFHSERKPAPPSKPRGHYAEQTAVEFIAETLKRRPEGVPQNELVKHHDPVMVERLLDLLVARGMLSLVFDRKVESGSGRRIYRLANQR